MAIHHLHEITEKGSWESFTPLLERGLFLQSFSQKKLYEDVGQKTWLFECPATAGSSIRSLVTKVTAKRGTFLFLPYGPMCDSELEENSLAQFFNGLKELTRSEKASFIRISPFWNETDAAKGILRSLGFRQAPLHMLAETLWLLDIEKPEEQLLMEMDKKHRNLIRRAEKDGVTISMSRESESTERFIDLHWQTVERHGFTPYTKDYFRSQVREFADSGQVQIFEAWWQGHLLASAIIMFYGQSAAYHHGASSSIPEHRKIPASYLLQWEVIREAKKKGCKIYNFWGIAPDENPKHPFYGITHFKTGFGGRRVDLIPCHDLVVHSKYYLNWTVEKIRKWRRGF